MSLTVHVNQLKQSHDSLPWYLRWLFPRKLRDALRLYVPTDANSQKKAQAAWLVCVVYLQETPAWVQWIFNRFHRCLKEFSDSLLVQICRDLHENKQLTSEQIKNNFDLITESAIPDETADFVSAAQKMGLFSEKSSREACRALISKQHGENLAHFGDLLIQLKDTRFFTVEDSVAQRTFVYLNEFPEIIKILEFLKLGNDTRILDRVENIQQLAPLFTPDVLESLSSGLSPLLSMSRVCEALVGSQMIVPFLLAYQLIRRYPALVAPEVFKQHVECLLSCRFLNTLPPALVFLGCYGLLSGEQARENFDAIIKNRHLRDILKTMQQLKKNRVLTQENAQALFKKVLEHPQPWHLTSMIEDLANCQLLTNPNNLDAVLKALEPKQLALSLYQLRDYPELLRQAQENFELILQNRQETRNLLQTLTILSRAGLLIGEDAVRIRAMIVSVKSLELLERALKEMQFYQLLTGESARKNLTIVLTCRDLADRLFGFEQLRRLRLFYSENAQNCFEQLFNHSNPKQFGCVLEQLSNSVAVAEIQSAVMYTIVHLLHETSEPEVTCLVLKILYQEHVLSGSLAEQLLAMMPKDNTICKIYEELKAMQADGALNRLTVEDYQQLFCCQLSFVLDEPINSSERGMVMTAAEDSRASSLLCQARLFAPSSSSARSESPIIEEGLAV